jgi:hypothetical protein
MEADAPLIIDADAPLALAISFQCLQAITGWNPQISEHFRGVQESQFSQRHVLNGERQAAASFTPPYLLCFRIGKRLDH